MKTFIALLSFVFFNYYSSGQKVNYITYHKEITKAEEFFIKGQAEKAIDHYKKTFKNYPKTFARDALIALQISNKTKDKRFFNYFYSLAVLNGIEWNLLTQTLGNHSYLTSVDKEKKSYKKMHRQYAKSLDSTFRNEVLYLLYKDDSLRKVKGNKLPQDSLKNAILLKQLETNAFLLKELINQKGFPGEHNTGLLNPILERIGKQQPTISKFCPVPIRILAHCKCGLQILNNELLKAIEDGELHPKDYALQYEWSQNGFLQQSWKDKYYLNNCARTVQGKRYNFFLNWFNYSKDSSFVNKCRSEIGMFSLEHYDAFLKFGKENNLMVKMGFQGY